MLCRESNPAELFVHPLGKPLRHYCPSEIPMSSKCQIKDL